MSGLFESVTVDLETVTPLFLAGADPRGEPELRPPAFRGAMRYWFRAVLGGVVGDMVKVRTVEGEIFGAALDKSQGSAQASEVMLCLTPRSTFRPRRLQKQEQEIGKNYFLWSLFEVKGKDPGKHQPSRRYFLSGEKLRLTLSQRPYTPTKHLTYALYSLWLLVHLGGLGSRSRRMMGSLDFVEDQKLGGLSSKLKGNPEEVSSQLGNGISFIRNSLKKDFIPLPVSNPEFDVLHPDFCKIWVLGRWDSYEQAFEDVGKKMQDFRNRREPDRTNMRQWFSGKPIDRTIERVIFGLPLVYRYSKDLKGTIRAVIKKDSNFEDINRRASPLWLSLTRTDKGYLVIATLFKSRFLPQRAQLTATVKNVNKIPPPNDYGLIEAWIEESFSATVVEVKYE